MAKTYTRITLRVDELLRERGKTRYWLVKETGLAAGTVYNLTGGKGLQIPTMEKIIDALECNVADLFNVRRVRRR